MMSSLRLFHGYLPTSFAKPEDVKDDYDQLRLRVSWILEASEDRLLLEPLQRQENKISEKKDSWTRCKKNQKTYVKSIRSSIINSSCSSISSCGGGECGCCGECGCSGGKCGCGGNGGDSIGGEGFRKDVKVSLY